MQTNSCRIQGAALTDIGLRRAVNEDSVLSAGSVFAVADGMGGHEAGDLASKLCIQTLAQLALGDAAVHADDATAGGLPHDVVPEVPSSAGTAPAARTRLPHATEVLAQVERADAAIRMAIGSRGGTTLCALALVGAEPGGGTWPGEQKPAAVAEAITLNMPVQPTAGVPAAAMPAADVSALSDAPTGSAVARPRYLETTHESHLVQGTAATPLPLLGSEADPTTDVLPYVPAANALPSETPNHAAAAGPRAAPGSPAARTRDRHEGHAEGAVQLMLLNVGDSRGYRLRGGVLSQLTLDHSAVQELIDSGTITEAEARIHPQRNLITRALGAGGNSVPDAQFHALVPGDRYLLCSDGLTGEVEHAGIERILTESPDRTEAMTRLVAAALASGGRDNISVVIVDVTG